MDVQRRVNRETLAGTQNLPLNVVYEAAGGTVQMKVSDTVVVADTLAAAGSDGVCILVLPSVAEAIGQFYVIEAPEGSTGGDLSVHVKETGAELTTNGDLDGDDESVVLFSTGRSWIVVKPVAG
jgi:hypothetical protein